MRRVTIRTVAVIGAGTMGAGIAQVCAQAGWNTRLFDAFPAGLNAEEINNPDFGLQIVLSTAGVQIDFDYINLEIKYITREGKLQISQGQVELTSGKFNL